LIVGWVLELFYRSLSGLLRKSFKSAEKERFRDELFLQFIESISF
jgi:hypothetical protein